MDTLPNTDVPIVPIVVGVLFLVALIGLLVWTSTRRKRSEELRERFGPEYERAVNEYGDAKLAEQKLRERQERVEGLELRALAPEDRLRFARLWREVQGRFVDAPADAIGQANTLIKQVMHERGYPVGDFDQRAEDISVRHPLVVQHYRAAREIAQRNERGQATTEDLRRALVHYRGLFHELLDEGEAEHDGRDPGQPAARGTAQSDGRERGASVRREAA